MVTTGCSVPEPALHRVGNPVWKGFPRSGCCLIKFKIKIKCAKESGFWVLTDGGLVSLREYGLHLHWPGEG